MAIPASRSVTIARIVVALLVISVLAVVARRKPPVRVDSAGANGAQLAGWAGPRTLVRAHSSAFSEETRQVITDSATLRQVWTAAFAGRDFGVPVPRVDFAREIVIVAGMGARSSGGYAIHVDSVRAMGNALEIFVRSIWPGPQCKAGPRPTEPVVFVAVPWSGLRREFVESRVTGCPRY